METKRIVDINTYWATIVKDTAQFGQIAVAENPEFNRLSECIFRALKDSFIHSATEYGVKRWESMLQIAPSAGETLEERKARILTYLNLKLPYTWRVLKQLIEGIVGEGNVELNLDNDTQTLRVVFNKNVDDSISDTMNDLISRVIPMNLVVECEYYLPVGYLAAEFLENANNSYMSLPLSFNTKGNKIEVEFDAYFTQGYEQASSEGCRGLEYGTWNNRNYYFAGMGGVRATGTLPHYEWVNYKMSVHNLVVTFYPPSGEEKTYAVSQDIIASSWRLWAWTTGRYLRCRRKNYIFKINGEKIVDLIPALDEAGSPCFVDKKSKQSFYNKATTPLVVGLTLAQARNLSKLPNSGGNLTISLPSNWQEDTGVVNALETARSKGWTITVQTYTPENGVMTLDLFDIWVRKTQDENGQYVDSDGTRWYVEWCNCMYTADGSTERDHGYESHPSVEEACNSWGLTPYVDPNEEELLIEEGIEQ